MKLLLDTHVFLWLTVNTKRLRKGALELLEDPANELLLSAVSAWEIAIKSNIGKMPIPMPVEVFVPTRMDRYGIRPLPIEHSHAMAVAHLPQIHRDPFDRLLVAQAMVEGIPIVTSDSKFDAYGVQIIQA